MQNVRDCVRPASRAFRLGFPELCIVELCSCDANAGFLLSRLDFEKLTFDCGIFANVEILSHARAVEPTLNPEDHFTGRVRELLYRELLLGFYN